MDTAGLQEVIETTQKADTGWFSKPQDRPYIDLRYDLWDIEWISFYVKKSKEYARELVKHDTFPRPIKLPTSANPQALYKAREVVAWVESFST